LLINLLSNHPGNQSNEGGINNKYQLYNKTTENKRGRRGRDRMVGGFTTCVISAYNH